MPEKTIYSYPNIFNFYSWDFNELNNQEDTQPRIIAKANAVSLVEKDPDMVNGIYYKIITIQTLIKLSLLNSNNGQNGRFWLRSFRFR